MLGGALLGAGIISGFKSLYDAADESRKIAARTEGVIKSMGNVAGVSAKQVGDLAGAISAKTGVDDEAIQSGQNLLLTFGNIRNEVGAGNDIFDQTSRLMVDMSAAMGKDASGSAIQLGKALNDPIKGITALSKAGVSFTEQQKEQIRTLVESGDVLGAQKIILGELERQFGGAAESMATPLDRAKVAVGNLAEEMGGHLLPIVGGAADGLLGLIEGFKTGETTADGFQGSMQTTGAVLADVASAVGDIAGVVGDVAGFFMDLPGPVQAGVAALGAFVYLKGPVSNLFETVALKAMYATDAIGSARSAGLRGAAGGLIGFLGGPWGIALGAATVGLGFLISGLNDSDEAAAESAASQGKLAAALEQTAGAIDATVRAGAAEDLVDSGVNKWADDLGLSVTVMTDALTGVPGALDQVNAAWRNALSGEYVEIIDANGQVTGTYTAQGDAMLAARDKFSALAGLLPDAAQKQRDVAAATEATTTATGLAVPTMDMFTAGLEAAGEAASDAQRETNMLKTALDVLTGANVSMIEVQSAYQDSLADATGALKDLNGTVLDGAGKLNLQSEAGRATADVLLGVRDSGNQLIATMVQQGKSADEVGAAEARLRQDFINTAGQMGITGAQAETLADQILGIPGERKTTVTADTSQATGAVDALVEKIRNAGGRVIYTGADVRNVTGVSARAAGGIIYGPGTGTSDSILGVDRRTGAPTSWVSAGEFVVNKKATDANRPLIEAINAGRDLKYLAAGGILDGLYRVPVGLTDSTLADLERKMTPPAGVAGSGAIGGGWAALFNAVKAAIPQARANSTYRPGDPGYHGRGKAVDFGFGSGPGGAGSAGLASINRFLHDNYGGNLAELIYDGIGDDRPDLKNGRPLSYSASTQAQHRNHVHAAVYSDGTNYVPETGYAVVHKGEAIVPASENQGAPFAGGPVQITLQLDGPATTALLEGQIVAHASATARNDRSWA